MTLGLPRSFTARSVGGRLAGVVFDKDGTLLDDKATYAPVCERFVKRFEGRVDRDILNATIGYLPTSRTFTSDSLFMTATHAEIRVALARHGLDGTEVTEFFDSEKPSTVYHAVGDIRQLFAELRAMGLVCMHAHVPAWTGVCARACVCVCVRSCMADHRCLYLR